MDINKLKDSYRDNKLIYHCGLLAILFLINCFVPMFSFFALAILLCLIVFEDLSHGFSLLVFCIPYCCIDEFASLFTYFACILVFLIKGYIKMLFIDNKKFSLPLLISMGVFTIYCLLPIGDYNLGLGIKTIIVLLLIFVLYFLIVYVDVLNLKFSLSLLSISLIISCVMFLTYFISPYMHAKTIWGMGEDYIRFSAIFMNPNTLAVICEFCLSLLTYLILAKKTEWTDIVAFITFAVLGFSTFSKTFFILFAVMMVVLFIYSFFVYKLRMLWLLAGVLILFLIMILWKGDYLTTYLNRFVGFDDSQSFEGIMDVLTTHRYDLWRDMVSVLWNNPLILFFGKGFGASILSDISAHNFYLSLVYQLGLVGTALFVTMFIFLLREIKKHSLKISKGIFVPLLILGMLMMVEDLFLYIY